MPGFPLPFGCRRSLLGHPIPAEELGPPCGRLTGQDVPARTSTGLPRSARVSYDRGGCPLYPDDGGAHPGLSRVLSRRLPLPSGQSFTPLQHPILRGCASRGINEGSSNSPVRPFPSPAAARMGRAVAWAFPRASHPADQEPTTHVEVGTGHRARTWSYSLNITSG
jgi:hypothetical protein